MTEQRREGCKKHKIYMKGGLGILLNILKVNIQY